MRYKLIAVAVFAALFPYCLNRTEALGYDFPIYYNAGAGSISSDYAQGAFVYSHRIVPVFGPLAKLPYWAAFGIFYAATAAAIYSLLRRISRHFDSYPVLVSALWIVVGGAGFIILRCGNVTGILALLVTAPLGAILAMCVKPYLAVFVVVHAAIFRARYGKGAPDEVPSRQGEPHLLG